MSGVFKGTERSLCSLGGGVRGAEEGDEVGAVQGSQREYFPGPEWEFGFFSE